VFQNLKVRIKKIMLTNNVLLTMEEQELVLCSDLKWRVAMVTKQRAPMSKPSRVGLLGTIRNPLAQNHNLVGFQKKSE
jgi:hypothetical protein